MRLKKTQDGFLGDRPKSFLTSDFGIFFAP